jgi:hypothetical protein
MFCPQCGSTQLDELKFCKSCGVNLVAVRQAVTDPGSVGKFDWEKTWVSEMLRSAEEKKRRKSEIERGLGITPETKRRNEIKGGVITASIGAGLMEAIVMNPRIPPETVVILRSLWVTGLIPLLVGFALIVNGVFVSKKGDGNVTVQNDAATTELGNPAAASFLPPKADTNPLEREIFSVTDETTHHLDESSKVKMPTSR